VDAPDTKIVEVEHIHEIFERVAPRRSVPSEGGEPFVGTDEYQTEDRDEEDGGIKEDVENIGVCHCDGVFGPESPAGTDQVELVEYFLVDVVKGIVGGCGTVHVWLQLKDKDRLHYIVDQGRHFLFGVVDEKAEEGNAEGEKAEDERKESFSPLPLHVEEGMSCHYFSRLWRI
jgi:hypothetical protein